MSNVAEVDDKKVVAISSEAETDNLIASAQEDVGLGALLKFKDGAYFINKDEEVPLGTKYIVHLSAFTKAWVKFVDSKLTDRKIYSMARGEIPPDREELDEPEKIGSKGSNGMSDDPWNYQYMLPLENMSSSEVAIFVTATVGGRRAVSDLVDKCARLRKKGQLGQPIIELQSAEMPTKYGKKQPRPDFVLVGWDDAEGVPSFPEASLAAALPIDKAAANKRDDMDDEIPF